MSRYIDADALVDAMCAECKVGGKCPNLSGRCYEYDMVREQPTADARENVHGVWLGSGDSYWNGYLVLDMWECSNCGYDADGADQQPEWKYCPNCGADMRGKKDG